MTRGKRDRREVERAMRDRTETGRAGKRTKRGGGRERAGNEFGKNYVSRPQHKLKQTT